MHLECNKCKLVVKNNSSERTIILTNYYFLRFLKSIVAEESTKINEIFINKNYLKVYNYTCYCYRVRQENRRNLFDEFK